MEGLDDEKKPNLELNLGLSLVFLSLQCSCFSVGKMVVDFLSFGMDVQKALLQPVTIAAAIEKRKNLSFNLLLLLLGFNLSL